MNKTFKLKLLMNNSIEINFTEELSLAIFALVYPVLLGKYAMITTLISLVFFIVQLLRKRTMAYMMLILLSMYTPSTVSVGQGGGSYAGFLWIYRMVLFIPMIWALAEFNIIRKNKFLQLGLFFVVCNFSLCLMWWIYTGQRSEMITVRMITLLFSTITVFYCSEIDIERFFRFFDIIILVFALYLIIEFFFRWTPYEASLYGNAGIGDARYNLSTFYRTKGLLGNPILSSIPLLFEICLIAYRSYQKNKINIVMLLIISVAAVLTISRTAIVGVLWCILLMLMLNLKITKRVPWKTIILIFLGLIVVISISDDALSFMRYRLSSTTSDSISFRQGNFGIILQVFEDYPLGLGRTQLYREIDTHYSQSSWISGFSTLDNFFLTMVGQYGLACIIPFGGYLYCFFYSLKYRKYRLEFYTILTIFGMIMFICFTHDWEVYVDVMIVLGAIEGILLRNMEMRTGR